MRQELRDKIQSTLPQAEFDNLYEEHTFEANGKIIDGYLRSEDKALEARRIEDMKDILGMVTLKEISLENLAAEVGVRLALAESDAKAVALIMLREVFYPVGDFYPGINDAILGLGGSIPTKESRSFDEQLLKREAEIEEMGRQKDEAEAARLADTIVSDSIANLMTQFPEAGEMVIGSQKAIAVKNMSANMKPMIKYWIQDYKEKMGYYKHSNLERVKYVCHDTNTRNMNEEERNELNLVLKSSDGEITLPYSTKRKKIDFSLVAEE